MMATLKKTLLAVIASTLCVGAFASPSGEKIAAEKYPAEILLTSSVPLKMVDGSSNAKLVAGEGGKTLSAVFRASSSRMREMRFEFVPTADGTAQMTLRAGEYRKENGERQWRWVWFDDVKIGGKLLPNGDFQNRFENWTPYKKAPEIAESPHAKFNGDFALFVNNVRNASVKISLKKGEKTSVSAMVSCDDSLRDMKPVNLSETVNVSTDSDGGTPFKKFAPAKGARLFGGMKFRIARPTSAKPNNVLFMSPRENATIDLSKSKFRGKYVYLLHTTPPTGKMRILGLIEAKFKDGRVKTISVSVGKDIASADADTVLDNALPVYFDDPKSKKGALYLSRFDLKGGDSIGELESLTFKSNGRWFVFAATVSSSEIFTTKTFDFSSEKWKPLDIDTLDIEAGSALDLSPTVEAPAGKYGRVVVAGDGRFEFEKRKGEEVRFKSANFFGLTCQFGNRIKTHEEIDRYVKLLKKHGFNSIRWRFRMDGDFSAPYQMKPLVRDLYDYFLYALGREGLYSFFYLCSHDTGDPSFKWNDRFTVKVKMMLGDPATREAWKKLAKMQLEHVNPHTGLAWKDDPSIATIEYWNEFELGISVWPSITAEGKQLANEKFREFLKKRYGDFASWTSNNTKNGTVWKSKDALDGFDKVVLDSYQNRQHPDFTRFVMEAMRDMQAFCRKTVLDEIGMKVATHQNNCLKTVSWACLAAEGGSYTAVNTYHSHPSSYELGANVQQNSSIVGCANYWRGTVVRKVSGMPIAVTEYQHCFFNKYMHEAGVLFPSYSALQGYSALVAFDSPAAFAPKKLSFFDIGPNPVFRANDFLTNFLFKRGDVKKSPHRVDVIYNRNFFEKSPYAGFAVNSEQAKIALMTGFALSFPDAARVPELGAAKASKASLLLQPAGAADINAAQNSADVGKSFGSDFKVGDIIKTLKDAAILPQNNLSDPGRGVFQSDTGEIYMDCLKRVLKVSTPRSAAAVLNPSDSAELGAFTVNSTTVPACVGLVAIDAKPLGESSRMVLVYSTDNVSDNIALSVNRQKILAWGKPPILVEVGKLSASLKVGAGKSFDVYRLKMSGARAEKIPAEVVDGVLKLEIDTSKHTALFFEIVAR